MVCSCYTFIVLAKLLIQKIKVLNLGHTQITDAGCATLASALNSGALLALEKLYMYRTPASAAAKAAVYAARANLKGGWGYQ